MRSFANDIAIIVLDRAISNAVEGVHYVKMWDNVTMGMLEDENLLLLAGVQQLR